MAILQDGRVFIVGGTCGGPIEGHPAELYDPVSEGFSTGPLFPKYSGTAAVTLDSGIVLLAGGRFCTSTPNATVGAWTYDPASNTIAPHSSRMAYQHFAQPLTLLPSGRALTAGGSTIITGMGSAGPVDAAELFWPGSGIGCDPGAFNPILGDFAPPGPVRAFLPLTYQRCPGIF